MADVKRSVALALAQTETIFDFYVKRRRAALTNAWERNTMLMINAALDLRELLSQIPKEELRGGLLNDIYGEMNIHKIISAVVLSGFSDTETFRAKTKRVIESRNKIDRTLEEKT